MAFEFKVGDVVRVVDRDLPTFETNTMFLILGDSGEVVHLEGDHVVVRPHHNIHKNLVCPADCLELISRNSTDHLPRNMDEYHEMAADWFKRYRLREGDHVLLERVAESHTHGWNNGWTKEMTRGVGKVGVLKDTNKGSAGVTVSFGKDISLRCPFFVLSPVGSARYCPLKEGQPFFGRDDEDEEWTLDYFEDFDADKNCPYGGENYPWYYAVPYEGNEHLILDRKAEPKVTLD